MPLKVLFRLCGTASRFPAAKLNGDGENWWGCSSVGRVSDRHAAGAGSISRCSKGFFSQSQLSVQTLLRVSVHPRVQSHALTSVSTLKTSCGPCQSSVDYGNTKTPSMHSRLGSATLSQLAFSEEKQPEFPIGEIPLGQ